MLEIKTTAKGYVTNQEISPRLFGQVGNTIVRVICEVPYYLDVYTLENSRHSCISPWQYNHVIQRS